MFGNPGNWQDTLKSLMEYEDHCAKHNNYTFGFALSGLGTYGWCLYDKNAKSFMGTEDGKSIKFFVKKEDAEEARKSAVEPYEVLHFLLAEIEQ